MSGKSKKEQRILLREYVRNERAEEKIFKKRAKKGPGVSERIRKKIPEKAMHSLEAAFEKGFFFLFDKGTPLLEKISAVDKAKEESREYRDSLNIMVHEKTLEALDHSAKGKINTTKTISMIEGAGLGIFGIGLPDIPIFLAMLLKTSYEVAAAYGFDFRNEEERPYTLALLKTIFSEGEEQEEFSKECDEIGRMIDEGELSNYKVSEEDLSEVSKVLATDLLVAKFIQGFTFAGVVGGPINYSLVHRVSDLAKLKYKKRFLYRLMHDIEHSEE